MTCAAPFVGRSDRGSQPAADIAQGSSAPRPATRQRTGTGNNQSGSKPASKTIHQGSGSKANIAHGHSAEACSSERLVFFSPDGNEDPADIVRLDDCLINGADLAIARRFGPGAVNEEDDQFIRLRARVNDTLSQLANHLFHRGPRVYDTINGFRALRRGALLELDTTVKRFPIEYQITLRAMQRGWRIDEVPTREGQRIGGERKASSWPVGVDHLRVLVTELPNSRLFQ